MNSRHITPLEFELLLERYRTSIKEGTVTDVEWELSTDTITQLESRAAIRGVTPEELANIYVAHTVYYELRGL